MYVAQVPPQKDPPTHSLIFHIICPYWNKKVGCDHLPKNKLSVAASQALEPICKDSSLFSYLQLLLSLFSNFTLFHYGLTFNYLL